MKMNTIIILAATLAVASIALLSIPKSTIRAATNHVLHPGYSCCGRCGRTWDIVRGHSTPYGDAHMTVTTPNITNSWIQVEGVPNDGKSHEVTVTNGAGCFPLCEDCWRELKTPQARLPYYRKLIDEWKQWDTTNDTAESKWSGMKASVLAGN